MKWLEEEIGENEYPVRYRKTADSTIIEYRAAPWRRAAVASIRKLLQDRLKEVAHTDEPRHFLDREQLRVWLNAHDLPDVVDMILHDDSTIGISMSGALLAEAAGTLFCNRPTVLGWRMVGQIIENDPVARRVLVDLVDHRMLKRLGLREDIRKVARAIAHQFKQDPDGSARRDDRATISEIYRQWEAKPDLHEIWFGLRSFGHIMPFRRDWHIFDLLFALDAEFAAELIEMYGKPYEPALILQFGLLDPNRRFADWMRLIKVALPAFETDGTWNGRVLLPLLLLAAHDAMCSRHGYRDANKNATEHRDARLAELAEAVASALWKRPDGGAVTLRWGGWLFRSAMSALDGEQVPFPRNATSRARPAWLTIQALTRSKNSIALANLRPADLAPEDELCLEAVRILAAQEHDCDVPGRDLLFQMLPGEPEDFLENEIGRRKRELPSLFVIWGKRADAFGTRVLAAALFDEDVATKFAGLWQRTLTLREISEHNHAFRSDENAYDDHARRASETIRFVIALGINLIDYVQDIQQTIAFEDRRVTTLSLFSTLHDATREMLATDPIGRRDMEKLHDHLCVRRLLYEDTYAKGHAVAAPLAKADSPTIGELLCERCEVSRSFFESLQILRIKGFPRERIEDALGSVGVRLDLLIEQAQRLNEIELSRILDLTGFEITASAKRV